jgi:hypothetical protein
VGGGPLGGGQAAGAGTQHHQIEAFGGAGHGGSVVETSVWCSSG